MFTAPILAGDSHTTLDFIEDQEDIILVADLSQQLEKLAAEMIVAALTLNRLDDDRGNINSLLIDDVADSLLSNPFLFHDGFKALSWRERKIEVWRRDTRPGELREVSDLAWIGIGEAHGISASAMKCAFEMDDLCAAFAAASGQVFSYLPIHRSFKRILDRE